LDILVWGGGGCDLIVQLLLQTVKEVFDAGFGILLDQHQTFSLASEDGDVGPQQFVCNLSTLDCNFHWVFACNAGDADNLLFSAMECDVP
jgi:hypothetical protein